MAGKEEKADILFETDFGSVKILRYCNRLRIIYGNLILEQSMIEYRSLMNKLHNLNKYFSLIGHSYYKRFLISLKKYTRYLTLSSKEIEELLELMNGADDMLELEKIIAESTQLPGEKH